MLKFIRRTTPLLAVAVLALFFAGCSRQARKARHEQRADGYFNAGQYPQAEVEYLNVLRLDPQNAHAIGRMGLIYYEEGRIARAYPLVMKANELLPQDTAVRLRAGSLRLAQGKIDEARADAEAILTQDPRDSEAPLLLAQSVRTDRDVRQTHQRLEALLRQTGETAALNIALGTVLLREGDISNAETTFKKAVQLDPKSSAAHYALGTLYWAQNRLTNADTELKAAAELGPQRSLRRVRYADFKLKTGGPTEAKRILTDLSKAVPDYVPAWLSLAEVALVQTNYTECDALLNQALLRDPDNFNALMLSGRLALATGATDKALDTLQKLAALYRRSPQAQFTLALAYAVKGDPANALQKANEAVALDPDYEEAVLLQAQLNLRRDNGDAAIASLTRFLKKHPQLAQAYLLLGNAYAARNNPDDALAAYRQLANILPRNPQVPFLIGALLQQQGKNNEARAALESSLTLAPGYLPAFQKLVELDLTEHKTETAMQRVQAELQKKGRSPELQTLLAQVLISNQDTNHAEAALQKAIELDPNYQPAYFALAQLYSRSHRNGEALEKLRQLAAQNPRQVAAWMLMGLLQTEEKDYSGARDSYEKLLAINPNSSAALNNLAYLYSEKFGQWDKAYEAARKARDLLPNDPYCADTLGWILLHRGEYSWALNLIQESAEKLPHQPEVQFHLGSAYYMSDEDGRARLALTRALAAPGDLSWKPEASNRLALLQMDPRTAGSAELQILEARLREQPDDPVALERFAAIKSRNGAVSDAVRAYEQALVRSPKNPRLMYALASLYSEPLHNPQRAFDLLQAAYTLAPEDPDIAGALGRLTFARGNYKSALAQLEQAARKKAADPQLSYDLGMAYYSVGRVDDSTAAVQAALRLNSSFPQAENARQFLELVSLPVPPEKAAASESRLRQMLAADPANVPALMATAAIAEQKQNPRGAIEYYQQVLKRYPDFIPAIKRLAILEAAIPGEEDKAYDLALKARQALPEDSELANALGSLLYRREDYRGVIRVLGGNSQSAAPDTTALYYLGMAHFRLNERKEGKTALQQALAAGLSGTLGDAARQALAQMK